MDWLANLSLKWVLVAVGLLLVARAVLRATPARTAAALRELLEAGLIAAVGVFLLLRPFVVQAYYIPSPSMHPTLLEGDRLLVNKLAYRLGPLRRGEIIVFRPPPARVPEDQEYVKRVIGLPGETIEVVPQRLLVDGETLLRISDASASQVRAENYDPTADIGFTYPLLGGTLTFGERVTTLTPGPQSPLEGGLTVAVYGPGDVIDEEPTAVFLNGKPLLAVPFGPLHLSRELNQWGGSADLAGRVYSVAGTPRLLLVRGRRLSLDEGHVLVNGYRLVEPYLADDPAYAMAPLAVPAGCYFVMGDNRNQSFDSHAWGPLPRSLVLGRAEWIFWPPGRAGRVQHFRYPPLPARAAAP